MDCLLEYRKLITAISRETERLEKIYPMVLQCRPGCVSCCRELRVLPLEAAVLKDAIKSLSNSVREAIRDRAQENSGACPLLIDNLCCLYPARPLICRTHGLPIGYIDHERQAIEVSACPINFSPEARFEIEGILLLDSYNERLVAINSEFARTSGRKPGQRISIREIILSKFL